VLACLAQRSARLHHLRRRGEILLDQRGKPRCVLVGDLDSPRQASPPILRLRLTPVHSVLATGTGPRRRQCSREGPLRPTASSADRTTMPRRGNQALPVLISRQLSPTGQPAVPNPIPRRAATFCSFVKGLKPPSGTCHLAVTRPPMYSQMDIYNWQRMRGSGRVRIGIIGAGFAGLTAGYLLSRQPGHRVVLYERAAVPGGRASLSSAGEHCPRVFLDDYYELFRILRQISTPDGTTLLSAIEPLDRYYYTARSEWVKISRLFGFQARELSWRDRLGIARIGWPSALLAEHPDASNTNRYSPGSNWSVRTLAKAATKVVASRGALALGGATDDCLLTPWLADLAAHGVDIRLGSEVSHFEGVGGANIWVHSGGTSEMFDAVIMTAFVPDAKRILDASGLEHRLTVLDQTHLKAITVSLDPRESILCRERPALYHSEGVGLLLQPRAARCVAVSIRGPRNDDEYILWRVRRDIGLQFPVVDVAVRPNLLPEEGLYTADYVHPSRILRVKARGIYFAGSYVKNRYPVDSGEGACLTALNAVAALRRDFPDTSERPEDI